MLKFTIARREEAKPRRNEVSAGLTAHPRAVRDGRTDEKGFSSVKRDARRLFGDEDAARRIFTARCQCSADCANSGSTCLPSVAVRSAYNTLKALEWALTTSAEKSQDNEQDDRAN